MAAAARTGRPRQAAEELGFAPTSYDATVEADPQFAVAVEAARARYVERLEAAADQRAVEGWLEPVFQLGQHVGDVRKYSDTLLLRRLEALAPERYRANVRVDARVAAGVLVVPSAAPDAAAWAAAFSVTPPRGEGGG